MIRINCPNCSRKLRVDESIPKAQCPACGKKFEVSAGRNDAAKAQWPDIPAGRSLPKSGRAPQKSTKAPHAAAPEIDEGETPAYDLDDAPAAEPARNQQPEDKETSRGDHASEQETNTTSKRKKKRKRRRENPSRERSSRSSTNFLVAGIMLSVGIVVVAGFLLFKMFGSSGGPSKPAIDPEAAIAELEKLGALVQRDTDSPDKLVIAISAAQCDISGKNAKLLEPFPKLRKLDLSHTKFNNIDLEHLQGLTELRELNLNDTKVSDAIEPLSKLVNLEKLDLSNTLVRDTGLSNLKGLTKLKSLSLGQTLASGLELQGFLPSLKVYR